MKKQEGTENPWVDAALSHVDALMAAGVMTTAAGLKEKVQLLQSGALPPNHRWHDITIDCPTGTLASAAITDGNGQAVHNVSEVRWTLNVDDPCARAEIICNAPPLKAVALAVHRTLRTRINMRLHGFIDRSFRAGKQA